MQLRINCNILINPFYIGALYEKQLKMRIIIKKFELAEATRFPPWFRGE